MAIPGIGVPTGRETGDLADTDRASDPNTASDGAAGWAVRWRAGESRGVGMQASARDASHRYSPSTCGAIGPMFSIAVKGYGIVIWDGEGEWRTFGATESHSAMLAARVEAALEAVPAVASDYDVREALLAITGAGLLSADCDHEPGQCEGEDPAS